MEISSELLKYAIENDMINMSYVQEQMEMNKRKEILNNHKFSIWKGKDGNWRTYILGDDGKRILKKRSSQESIEELVVSYYTEIEKKRMEDYSFRFYFQNWKQKQIMYGISNNTVTKYDSDYIRYFKDTDFEKSDIRKITEEDITVFVTHKIKQLELSEKSGKSLYGYISGVFKHARINRIINENPCEYVDTKRFNRLYFRSHKSVDERVFSGDQLDLLMKQLEKSYIEKPNYIPAYAVELAIYTGMRIGEIVALKWENIRDDLKIIIICQSEKFDRVNREYKIESTKTGKERQFPISDKIECLLYRLKKVELQYGYLGEYVFQNENGKIHSSSIAHCIRYKCIQAGIPEKSIHALRRTLNSKLRCAGVSGIIASSLMGHTEDVNSLNYTYDISEMDYKREVLSKII